MKKRIQKIVNLILVILVTLFVFAQVSYMYRDYTRLMGFYGLKRDSVDVVMVGTSITFASFMPMEAWNDYGVTAYDYCTNVQFENSLLHSIKEVLKTQNPKLIMVDIDPFVHEHYVGSQQFNEEMQRDYINCNLDSMKYSLNRMELTYEITRDTNGGIFDYLNYYFDIARYHSNGISLKQFNNSLHDVNYGYGYLDKKGGENYSRSDFAEYSDGEKEFSSQEQRYWDDLMEETSKLDCEVVFYCPAQFYVFKDAIERKNYIKRLLNENGRIFWDFCDDMDDYEYDYDMDFWGFNHFDSLGAEKSTKQIMKKILDNYDIPDRRGDKNYLMYEDDYSIWKNMKDEYNAKDRK